MINQKSGLYGFGYLMTAALLKEMLAATSWVPTIMEVKSACFGGQTHLAWAHFRTSAVGRVGKVAGDHKVKRQKHSKTCHQKPQLDTMTCHLNFGESQDAALRTSGN